MHDHASDEAGELASDQVSLLRIIDAAANRTLEGLRVVEDAIRFGANDRHLSEGLKQTRHRIATALNTPAFTDRIRARDTLGDVGTDVRTAQEVARTGLQDIVQANFARAQEGLRTLAECSKAIHPIATETFEQCRYDLYTLQKSTATTNRSNERLANARLYVLVDGRSDLTTFEQNVRTLIEAQVDILQLRDKQLDDRNLLERAKTLCDLTRAMATDEHRVLAVINDRADVAATCGADGLHLGQDELPLAAARSIVGTECMIGISTHGIEQARQAVLEGADYLGVGPTFPSQTKSFDSFPGIDLVSAVADEISLPAFAIGGIQHTNVQEVIAAGLSRIAVSGAVREDVVASVRKLKTALQTRRASE